MLHTDQIFKCEYSSNFNFIVIFQYREIYVAVFTVLRMGQFEFFPLMPSACHSNVMYMPCEWLNVK